MERTIAIPPKLQRLLEKNFHARQSVVSTCEAIRWECSRRERSLQNAHARRHVNAWNKVYAFADLPNDLEDRATYHAAEGTVTFYLPDPPKLNPFRRLWNLLCCWLPFRGS